MSENQTRDNLTILRRKDLARLGVSTVTVWRLRNELPPAIQVSKGVRGWRASDIADWLDSRASVA